MRVTLVNFQRAMITVVSDHHTNQLRVVAILIYIKKCLGSWCWLCLSVALLSSKHPSSSRRCEAKGKITNSGCLGVFYSEKVRKRQLGRGDPKGCLQVLPCILILMAPVWTLLPIEAGVSTLCRSSPCPQKLWESQMGTTNIDPCLYHASYFPCLLNIDI